MFNLFRKQKEKKPDIETRDTITLAPGKSIIIDRKDKITHAEDNIKMLEAASQKSGIPVFKGVVKHIYESDFTGYKDKCPRCGGQVLRHFSNFAYATQKLPRLLASPAGLFCQDCETVIVDDDLIQVSIDNKRFEYRGVFSVESGYREASIIETINGEKPVFILDENQQEIEGLFQSVHQPRDSVYYDPKNALGLNALVSNRAPQESPYPQRQPKKKNKAKNKAVKQSKKANRK